MTWEDVLTTKFELLIDTCLRPDCALCSSCRAMEKIEILLSIEKVAEALMLILHAL